MLAHGITIGVIRFDESLIARDLDGTSGQIAESGEFFYCASHGEYRSSSYSVILHSADWNPCTRGLGLNRLAVAVFDTCDLLDLNDPTWSNSWTASVGVHLRLLLGFASPATVAEDSTIRGRAFASKIIQGDPIGPAWLEAVHSTAYPGIDLAVAVGFGDDPQDARWALQDMKLADLPRPRKASRPVTEVEVCH
jgi:hypothetical protein